MQFVTGAVWTVMGAFSLSISSSNWCFCTVFYDILFCTLVSKKSRGYWDSFLFICSVQSYLLQGNKSQLGRWDSGWRAWRVQQTWWRPTHLCGPAVSPRKCLCQVPYYSHCCCLCQCSSREMVCRLVLDDITFFLVLYKKWHICILSNILNSGP